MSNFIAITKLKKSNKWRTAAWIDDHFGKHQYGVKFLDDDTGLYYSADKCETRDPVTPQEEELLASDFNSYFSREDDTL